MCVTLSSQREGFRREVVGSPLFYALLAAALAHPF